MSSRYRRRTQPARGGPDPSVPLDALYWSVLGVATDIEYAILEARHTLKETRKQRGSAPRALVSANARVRDACQKLDQALELVQSAQRQLAEESKGRA